VAAVIYEDFVTSYPEDENAAYAERRVAECFEKLSPIIERDQANTFKAIERFTFLKNRYAMSPYAKDADAHVLALTRKVAARELYVGEFYYKWEKYNASIIRLEYFLEKYPDAVGRDKALFYLAQDCKQLNNEEKAQAYLDRLRREYPNSAYVGPRKKERKRLQLASAGSSAANAPGAGPPAAAPLSTTGGPGKEPASSADFSYTEKPARQIDLRPVDASPGEGDAPSAGQAQENPHIGIAAQKPADGVENAGQSPAETTAASPEAQKASPPAETSGDAAVGSGRAARAVSDAPGNGADKPDAAAKGDKSDQAKKTGDKKDSLGFFTQKKPVDVVADTMEGLEKGKIVVFKGNVIAKQVDLYMFSDMLTAYMNQETNEIERAKAEGNVKIVKLDRTATCKEAFFYNDKGEIILKGDVVVFSAKDKVQGDTVTYYIDEDRVYVQGENGKRAKAVISPK
jgi:lipopolysaccharide transport protein LptA